MPNPPAPTVTESALEIDVAREAVLEACPLQSCAQRQAKLDGYSIGIARCSWPGHRLEAAARKEGDTRGRSEATAFWKGQIDRAHELREIKDAEIAAARLVGRLEQAERMSEIIDTTKVGEYDDRDRVCLLLTEAMRLERDRLRREANKETK